MPRESQNPADFSEVVQIPFRSDHNQYVALQRVYSLNRNGLVFCHQIWLILKPNTVSDTAYTGLSLWQDNLISISTLNFPITVFHVASFIDLDYVEQIAATT